MGYRGSISIAKAIRQDTLRRQTSALQTTLSRCSLETLMSTRSSKGSRESCGRCVARTALKEGLKEFCQTNLGVRTSSQLKGVRTVLISGPQDNVAGTSRWTAQPAPPATVMRRSLHHLHEECAEEAKNQDFYGQALTIPINLQRMGFGPVVQWNGDKLPAEKDLENVASTVAVLPACETRPGRPYHSGVAADLCAAASYDALWQT